MYCSAVEASIVVVVKVRVMGMVVAIKLATAVVIDMS